MTMEPEWDILPLQAFNQGHTAQTISEDREIFVNRSLLTRQYDGSEFRTDGGRKQHTATRTVVEAWVAAHAAGPPGSQGAPAPKFSGPSFRAAKYEL